MKLLLDQRLPRSAAELLRQAGHDVVHAGERGLASASDEEILVCGRRGGGGATGARDFRRPPAYQSGVSVVPQRCA